jgi:hypothetical protein
VVIPDFYEATAFATSDFLFRPFGLHGGEPEKAIRVPTFWAPGIQHRAPLQKVIEQRTNDEIRDKRHSENKNLH